MRDTGIAVAFIAFVVAFAMTNGFQSNPVASTDVTVRQAAPTVNDDIDRGFLPGYQWVDQAGQDIYGLVSGGDGTADWDLLNGAGGGAGGHIIQDEGIDLTARTNLNFIGAGITCVDDTAPDATDCTIGSAIHEYGVLFTDDTSPDAQVLTTAGVFEVIVEFDQEGESTAGITIDTGNNDITIASAGVYAIGYSASYSGSANREIDLEIFIDGVGQSPSTTHRTMNASGAVGVVASMTIIFPASGGEVVDLRAAPEQNGDSITVFNGIIAVNEIQDFGSDDLPALADDSVWVGSATSVATASAVPDCNGANVNRIQYDTATNAWSCETDPIDLTADVTGILTVPNGGTGAATHTNHGVLLGQAGATIVATGAGTANQLFTSNGAGADPAFVSAIIVTGVTVTTSAGIQLATGLTNPPHSEGLIFYDETEKTVAIYNEASDVTLQLGQEQFLRATNNSGSQIDDGDVVYISGALGNRPTIALARSDAAATAVIIGVTTHDIANNATGYVTTFGVVHNFDTSSFTAGIMLFLDATIAGDLTDVAPSAPNFPIQVATALNSTVNGAIFVNSGPTDVVATMVIQDLDINTNIDIGGVVTIDGATDALVITNVNGEIVFTETTNDVRIEAVDQTVGDGIFRLPNLQGTIDVGVTTALTQTLTNKTITGATNIIDLDALDTQGAKTDEFCLTVETTSGAEIELQTCGGGGVVPPGRLKQVAETYLSMPGVIFIGGVTTHQLAADTVYFFPIFVASTITVDKISMRVTIGGGGATTTRLGIFEATIDWQPDALIADWGQVATDAAGFVTVDITDEVLPAGRYVVAAVADAATTFRAIWGAFDGAGIRSAWNTVPFVDTLFLASQAGQHSGGFTDPGVDWTDFTLASNPNKYIITFEVGTP